jgi:hypothetical protein
MSSYKKRERKAAGVPQENKTKKEKRTENAKNRG